ncbi:LysR family transcriptional regulator, partial [Nocardiopsis sp. MG754419]|uniref:LysR family transcriptional regulator n=1 Tax=Nocardiopsis sp. MG754419 TaxID=2259865 RepID=UPI001BACE8F1
MGDAPDGSRGTAVPAPSHHAGRPPDLSLTGLRVLVEVADQGSFSAAAHSLSYTQSAISRQISALEQTVGTRLFERHARGVALTSAGEALLRHAAKAVAHVRAAELEIDGLRDRLAGRLTIGAYPIAAASVIPQAMSRLSRRHPALLLALREASTPEQLRLLRGRRIEVAVVARGQGLPDYDLTGLNVQGISRGRGLGVVLPEGHPLAADEIVKVADLEEEPWV